MASTSEGTDALTRAMSVNTKLASITLDGPGSELNFKEMRSAHTLNLGHKRLRLISGTVIGAVAGMNRGLTDMNLEANELLKLDTESGGRLEQKLGQALDRTRLALSRH